jgi:hypothetical protein
LLQQSEDSDRYTRQLKLLEAQLLSKTIRPGFRQPPKAGKPKKKKNPR